MPRPPRIGTGRRGAPCRRRPDNVRAGGAQRSGSAPRRQVTKEELYKMLAHEDLKKAGLLIFANKQDVKECMTVAEISQFLKLTSIKDHQWHIQACCALTGEGLCQGLEWMMSRLKIR